MPLPRACVCELSASRTRIRSLILPFRVSASPPPLSFLFDSCCPGCLLDKAPTCSFSSSLCTPGAVGHVWSCRGAATADNPCSDPPPAGSAVVRLLWMTSSNPLSAGAQCKNTQKEARSFFIMWTSADRSVEGEGARKGMPTLMWGETGRWEGSQKGKY